MPLKRFYKLFQEKGLSARVVFIGAGKLGLPAHVVKAMAMGVDVVYIAREAMMAIGCIQAQVCHKIYLSYWCGYTKQMVDQRIGCST